MSCPLSNISLTTYRTFSKTTCREEGFSLQPLDLQSPPPPSLLVKSAHRGQHFSLLVLRWPCQQHHHHHHHTFNFQRRGFLLVLRSIKLSGVWSECGVWWGDRNYRDLLICDLQTFFRFNWRVKLRQQRIVKIWPGGATRKTTEREVKLK